MKDYLLDRLTEASTVRGLIMLIGGLLGSTLSESDAVTLIAAANIIAGLIGAALPDKLK